MIIGFYYTDDIFITIMTLKHKNRIPLFSEVDKNLMI